MHKETIGKSEFMFKTVDSEKSLDGIFRLRYHVYCKECKFLDPVSYPDGMEQDKYDPYAVHFTAEDSLGLIGCVRMVMDSPNGFPLEEHYKGKFNIDWNSLPRNSIAELSRLIICKEYRRRREDGLYYTPDFAAYDKTARIRPMAFGLYRELYQESKRRGITHWVAIMEESLWILLRLHNIVFHPIGDEFNMYGKVKPYIGVISEIEQKLMEKVPGFFQAYFLEGLPDENRPFFR